MNHVGKPECNTHVMKSMLNANYVSEPVSNALVKHSMRYVKFESLCAICNKCLFDANQGFCYCNIENELRKLKGKNVVDSAVSKPIATTIALGMFKIDIEPIYYRLKNNRDAHAVYVDKTIEYTDTLRGFVERARKQNPSKPLLDSACMFTKHVQELLVYVFKTCPNLPKPSEKLVAVTPLNKDKRVRFVEPVTSSSNIPKKTDSLKAQDSNKPLLNSTGVKPTTSASVKPSGNTKTNRISRPSSSNKINKVEDQSRSVKSRKNKMN
ncbi:hypothetical protein Tco_0579374, partial [Tanacetum coccineum]